MFYVVLTTTINCCEYTQQFQKKPHNLKSNIKGREILNQEKFLRA